MAVVFKPLLLKNSLYSISRTICFAFSLDKPPENLLTFRRLCSQVAKTEGVFPKDSYSDNNDLSLRNAPKNLTDKLQTSAQHAALSPAVDFEYLDSIAPPLQKSFNLAPYADKSFVLQQLVKLGVDLSVIEAKGTELAKQFLTLSFDQDVKPLIQFLHNLGVPAEEYGSIITTNPYIFQRDIRILNNRIGYFSSRGFDAGSIARIVSRAPRCLNLNPKTIDARLGYVQNEFELSNNEVRYLITRNPKLLDQDVSRLKDATFCVREEMGFDKEESKALLMDTPKIWIIPRNILIRHFHYLHSKMGIVHRSILNFPACFTCRTFIIQQRHEYLVKLGRAQYDPTLPNYVSLKALVAHTDEAFCWSVARTSVADFNLFLKSF